MTQPTQPTEPTRTQKALDDRRKVAITRAKSGMEFLDEFFERKDWVTDINPHDLDMSDPRSCILGQVFEDDYHESSLPHEDGYDYGIQHLWGDPSTERDATIRDLGFEMETPSEDQAWDSWLRSMEYGALTEAWLKLITERIDTLDLPEAERDELVSHFSEALENAINDDNLIVVNEEGR